MGTLTLPSFQIIRHATKGGQKRISVRFLDPDIKPGDALLDVLNAKRGGYGSYSRIPTSEVGRQYGWVIPPSAWQDTASNLGTFDLWAPLRDAFEGAIDDWRFEVRAV